MAIGLLWPYVILAALAPLDQRAPFRAFAESAQIRGSAAPRIAREIVEEVWQQADLGNKRSWVDCMRERGCPVLI